MAAPSTRHDVALSFAPADAPLVRRIRAVLAANGYSVYSCEREPRAAALAEILDAVLRGHTAVVCASPAYNSDAICGLEFDALRTQVVSGERRHACVAMVGPLGAGGTGDAGAAPAAGQTGTLAVTDTTPVCCDFTGSDSAEAFDHAMRLLLRRLALLGTPLSNRASASTSTMTSSLPPPPVTRAAAAAAAVAGAGVAAGADGATPALVPAATMLPAVASAGASAAAATAGAPPMVYGPPPPAGYGPPPAYYAPPSYVPLYAYGLSPAAYGYGAPAAYGGGHHTVPTPHTYAAPPPYAYPAYRELSMPATPLVQEVPLSPRTPVYECAPASYTPPPVERTSPPATEEAAAFVVALPALPAYESRCIAIAKSTGHRCKLVARDKATGLCSTHIRCPPHKTVKVAAAAAALAGPPTVSLMHGHCRVPVEARTGTMQCAGIAKTTGQRCRIVVAVEKKFCHYHRPR